MNLGTGTDSVFGSVGDQINTGASHAVVIGFGADTITAGSGTASINVLAGDQLVTLGSGNDTVFGGAFDTIAGGSGEAIISTTARPAACRSRSARPAGPTRSTAASTTR